MCSLHGLVAFSAAFRLKRATLLLSMAFCSLPGALSLAAPPAGAHLHPVASNFPTARNPSYCQGVAPLVQLVRPSDGFACRVLYKTGVIRLRVVGDGKGSPRLLPCGQEVDSSHDGKGLRIEGFLLLAEVEPYPTLSVICWARLDRPVFSPYVRPPFLRPPSSAGLVFGRFAPAVAAVGSPFW